MLCMQATVSEPMYERLTLDERWYADAMKRAALNNLTKQQELADKKKK
jgi:hypothetical protein